MERLDLDYLDAFVRVIELGSFSAAAERLQLTQPAVSLQVRQLEKRLGVALVERVGRRTRPTAAGEALLAHAGGIDAAVSSALDAVQHHATGALGRVRLGTGATACIHLLPPVLRALRQKHPTLEITVTTGNTPDIVRAIDENVIDVGLVTLPASGRMLEVTPVLDDEFVLIAPRHADLPARVTASVLQARPILMFEPGGNTRRIADEWLARQGITLKPVMALGSVEAIKEMVAAGLGSAILPSLALGRAGDRKRLAIRSLAPRLSRKLALVVRRDKRLSRALRETIGALRALSSH